MMAFWALAVSPAQPPNVVIPGLGEVIGSFSNSSLAPDTVAQFLGIPYAEVSPIDTCFWN
jgi:hypothetical protein